MPILRGKVFHVTNYTGFDGIIKDGFIKNNQHGNFTYSFPQSNRSYARNRGWVSLFDLRAISDHQLERALSNFYFLNPPSTQNNPIFILFSEFLYPSLLHWTQARDEDAWEEMFIPDVEAFHPGDIPVSYINRVDSEKYTPKEAAVQGSNKDS